MSLRDSMVSYWSLDESSTGAAAVTRNDSHGTNHLTDLNTTPSAAGKVGNGADLETSNNEYLERAHNTTLSIANGQAFTFALWFKAESFSGQNFRTLISKATSPNFEYTVAVDVANNQVELQLSTDGSSGLQVERAFANTDFNWHFLVAWFDPVAQKLRLQLDNEATPAEAAFTGSNYTGTGVFRIGSNPNVATWRWDGIIDEVVFWKRVLATAERNFLYNSGNGRTYAELGVAFASGDLPVVTMAAPAATVSVGQAGNATGAFPVITLSAPGASVGIGGEASAEFPSIILFAPRATASGEIPIFEGNASGAIPGVVMVAPAGKATIGTGALCGSARAMLHAGLLELMGHFPETFTVDGVVGVFNGILEPQASGNELLLEGVWPTANTTLVFPVDTGWTPTQGKRVTAAGREWLTGEPTRATGIYWSVPLTTPDR